MHNFAGILAHSGTTHRRCHWVVRAFAVSLVALLVVAPFGSASFAKGRQAAVSQPPDRQFSQAVELFRQGQYKRAASLFGELAAATPPSRLASAAHIMFARSLYLADRIDEAREALDAFLSLYPRSRYAVYARYLLAGCLLRQGNEDGAITRLLGVAASDDSILSGRAFRALAALLAGRDESDVARLERWARGGHEIDVLRLAALEGWLSRGRLTGVIRGAESLLSETRDDRIRTRATELLEIARKLQRSNLRVGVILPLTGYFQEEGRSLLRGVQFALMRNRPAQVKVELVVRDSESSLLRAIKEAQELSEDERVVALIGELESDKSIAIGAIAAAKHLPTLVPVSTTTGVASVGNCVFQLNMDLEHRARVLAEYAVNELGYRNFAILAPADEYGIEMADAFAGRVDELGCTVVAQEWYYENAQDLSKQFKKIRKLGFLRFIADTLAAADTSGKLPSREQVEAVWRALNDTLKAHADPGDPDNLVDDEDIPVYGIDAIFFPIYAEDIPYVAPQFARFNIRARPLGGSYWYDPEALRTNGRYVDSLVFVSDWYLDEFDPVYRQFRDDFRLRMGASPDRWAAYGYDAMTLILKALSEGATTRGEVKRYLEHVDGVQGIRGLTTFKGGGRVNGAVNLIRYVRGRFERIR